jgi:RNA polymerase sigma factor (sigma-70 family)
MQAMDDMALLREYATRNSEAAFEELVARRIGFVYSAALRQVRDPLLAEEITQAVFILLAQKAGKISRQSILTGWLFKATRFTALAQMRDRAKRSLRTATLEKELQMQTEFQSAADEIWNQMSPLLDEALAALGEKDRQAVLLWFFENKSLAEVGSSLRMGEDTARKRVARALEKMRRHFSKRGVTSTTATLAGAISANSVHAAPVALAKSVTAIAIAKGAAASASTLTLIKGALKIMAWTKAKTTIVIGIGILLIGGTMIVTIKGIQGYKMHHAQYTNMVTSTINLVGVPVDNVLDIYRATAKVELVVAPNVRLATHKITLHAVSVSPEQVPHLIEQALLKQAGVVLTHTDNRHVVATYDGHKKLQ